MTFEKDIGTNYQNRTENWPKLYILQNSLFSGILFARLNQLTRENVSGSNKASMKKKKCYPEKCPKNQPLNCPVSIELPPWTSGTIRRISNVFDAVKIPGES